jgi:hypothetical protein
VEIALPRHLAPQPANGGLASRLNQQAQGFLDDGTLRSRAAAAHGLSHQAIVDVDVGPHRRVLNV